MSDYFKRVKDGLGGIAEQATAAGKAIGDRVAAVTGASPKTTIYVEFASPEDMGKARAAITALNGQDTHVVAGLEVAMVVKVQEARKSDAIMESIQSFEPKIILFQ